MAENLKVGDFVAFPAQIMAFGTKLLEMTSCGVIVDIIEGEAVIQTCSNERINYHRENLNDLKKLVYAN